MTDAPTSFPLMSRDDMSALCVDVRYCAKTRFSRYDHNQTNFTRGNGGGVVLLDPIRNRGKNSLVDRLLDMEDDVILQYGGKMGYVYNNEYHQNDQVILSPDMSEYVVNPYKSRGSYRILFPSGSRYKGQECSHLIIRSGNVYKRKILLDSVAPENIKEETICPICLDDYKDDTKKIFCSNGHSTCEACFNKMVSNSCPVCRVSITQNHKWKIIFKTLDTYQEYKKLFLHIMDKSLTTIKDFRYFLVMNTSFRILRHNLDNKHYWRMLEYNWTNKTAEYDHTEIDQINFIDEVIDMLRSEDYKKNVVDWYAYTHIHYELNLSENNLIEYLKEHFGAENALNLLQYYSCNSRESLKNYVVKEKLYKQFMDFENETFIHIIKDCFRMLNDYMLNILGDIAII